MKQFSIFLLSCFFFLSCSTSKKIDSTVDAYTKIDVYYFEKSIERPHTLLGRKHLETRWIFSESQLKKAAQLNAVKYGADAIVIKEEEQIYNGTSFMTTNQNDSSFTGKTTTNSTVVKPEYKSEYYVVYLKYTDH